MKMIVSFLLLLLMSILNFDFHPEMVIHPGLWVNLEESGPLTR